MKINARIANIRSLKLVRWFAPYHCPTDGGLSKLFGNKTYVEVSFLILKDQLRSLLQKL